MKIQTIIGLCSLALLILHSTAWAVQKEEDERWTRPKPPEYGPRWQVPESMQKGQSGQTGGSDSQEAQFFKSGSGPSGSAPSMQMQTMPTATMPKMQIAPTVGAPSLPRTQAPVVAPSRQPTINIPGVAR